jgi:hypothetical protein
LRREDDTASGADALVFGLGPEYPLLGALHHAGRIVAVEQRHPNVVELGTRHLSHRVIQDQPALVGKQRWSAEPDLLRIPPLAAVCAQDEAVLTPVQEILRVGDPDVRLEAGEATDWTVEHREASVE